MPEMSAEDREYLQQTARILVRGGYDPLEYIEESLLEMAGDSDGPLSERDLRVEVRNALIRVVTELTQEQATWPALTDYDRLKAALDTLETERAVETEALYFSYGLPSRVARGKIPRHRRMAVRCPLNGGAAPALGRPARLPHRHIAQLETPLGTRHPETDQTMFFQAADQSQSGGRYPLEPRSADQPYRRLRAWSTSSAG